MGHLRPLVGAVALLVSLVAGGCASDDDGAATEGSADPSRNEPSTSVTSELACPDTTTTTGATTSTGLPSVCEVIERIPPEELPPGGAVDYVVWSGTISGSVQTPGCEATPQSGDIILIVFSNGDVSGAGQTVSGAYSCNNGASIPEMTNGYGINGRMTDVFTLTFTDGVQLASEPIEDGHAVIVEDTGFGLVTIELACESC